ncbi:hypothetical protein [Streptomyces mexicanus]|uniref:hypothetical protein n=1 Tax=Streptomyces mexicanus TaxID=178566 RepID=UPI0013576F2F|nr:hypothetical protein [Streptomyces mexicanus]
MELRSVEELMDLLYACRGAAVPDGRARRTDAHTHALRTAALVRRSRPADKELQVAALVQGLGPLLAPAAGATGSEHTTDAADEAGALRAADAVRGLLGERVFRLVRQCAAGGAGPSGEDGTENPGDADALLLRQAREEARPEGAGPGPGVLEDWRTVLELVAAGACRLNTVE